MRHWWIQFFYTLNASAAIFNRLTRRNLIVLGGGALAMILAGVWLAAQHQATLKLKRRIDYLEAKIDQRNRQIHQFNAKIDALQLKLIKLNRSERKIRQIIGKQADEDNLTSYGMGGAVPDDVAAEFLSSEEYHQMIQGIDHTVENLNDAAEEQERQFQALWKTLKALKTLEAATPSIRPIEGGWISSAFGNRISPFTNKPEFHSGVDIASRKGTPILATADGRVKFAGVNGLMGNTIVIDHGFGIQTKYGHLSKICVDCGQTVKKGDMIGEMGSSGRSTGPHVHYEVRLNGVPVDAEKYMSQRIAQH